MVEPEFSGDRGMRFNAAMRLAPDARSAELAALRQVLNENGVSRCKRIVDLGAGQGAATSVLTEYLADDGELIAIDRSAQLLEQIPAHPRVRTLASNLDRIDVPSGSVDLVVSLATFHHVQDKTMVLAEMRRILAKDGLLLIVDVEHGSQAQGFLDEVVKTHCITGHDADFLDPEWVQLLARRSQMLHVRSACVPTPWQFESEAQMLTFMRDLFGLRISVGQLKPFVDRWLRPYTHPALPLTCANWSLGFHVLQRQN
jgi:SAM-dependent methyltransferase